MYSSVNLTISFLIRIWINKYLYLWFLFKLGKQYLKNISETKLLFI